MTLFSQVENADPVFQEILDVFFLGYSDPLTLSYTAAPLEIANGILNSYINQKAIVRKQSLFLLYKCHIKF